MTSRWPLWARLLLGLALLLALLYALVLLWPVLSPFGAALGIAYFLNPLANALERFADRDLGRRPWLRARLDPRAVGVGLLCAFVALVLAVVLLVAVPKAWQQVTEAAASVPRWAELVRAKAAPWLQELNLRYPEQVQQVREKLLETLRNNAPEIVSPITHGLQRAFSSALSFVLAVLNLLVVPVFAVYLLYDMNRIQAGLGELCPHRLRPYVYSRLGEVDRLLSAFVRGQVTVCLILGAFYGVGMTACGVPMGLLAGLVIGFFNLIPFMSYVFGLPLALVLSWLDDQSPERLLAVAIVFTFGQFVEGNFITPRIVGESLGLHSVVVMLAVFAGGSLFGFLGMLLAMPVTAALSVFWKDLRELYVNSQFYRRDAASP
ncbi:MAG: AI-2E family transporter [Vicinamibacteria bacterium]|nr:AI-2E family transporter [Vicinamibacteria bacterium]